MWSGQVYASFLYCTKLAMQEEEDEDEEPGTAALVVRPSVVGRAVEQVDPVLAAY